MTGLLLAQADRGEPLDGWGYADLVDALEEAEARGPRWASQAEAIRDEIRTREVDA